ncbi:MAG: zinc protease [Saprospiraceae bacterium]
MIEYSRFQLENGLRVIVHEDDSTPMAAVNVLYNVGAKDESPDKTGFAHLFEHLMFSGSKHVPDFDIPIQEAGGENNAFTNSDLTNFYDTVPIENLETVLWLESDRMMNLNIDQRSLKVQRKVVVEEFKETCLNEPYGDVWHHMLDMAYKVHPYRWPTIGMVPKHVEDATLEDVRAFYKKYYCPNNAVLVIAGNVKTADIKELVDKWFGDIPAGERPERQIPVEPPQTEFHQKIHRSKVPVDALYIAFHIPGRNDENYYAVDILSDVLCNGKSSRLYHRLLKDRKLFSQIDAYITGNIDPGLLIIEGRPAEGVKIEDAEAAVWEEIEKLKAEKISEQELQKFKNKIESSLVFSEASILNKAINLAFFELIGNANIINEEVEYYRKLTTDDVYKMANKILVKENCSELFYLAKETNEKGIKETSSPVTQAT